ncbi:MAG: phage integrase N-terminal SAM-like domain-containing protein [Clostridia bacterium]|nr:phage integrase N-terminal SAM-like domain-containing protein [Clostridia bacterium]
MPLKVVGGGLRPSTISMYEFMLKVMIPKLGDKRLTEISGVDIMRYLQYLRDEYKVPDGRTLSEKSVKHHFNILRNIFNYAERQGLQ